MALFFDQSWFDQRLRERGLTRDDVAAALRLPRGAVDEIWKDQREVTPNEVTMLARLLGAPAADVVSRAGVATPMPREDGGNAAPVLARLDDLDQRLSRIERAIADLQSLIIATRPQS
ncbi:MAG TPA: helix-turn-helix transcriptional regulator [Parvibaculum sp.]